MAFLKLHEDTPRNLKAAGIRSAAEREVLYLVLIHGRNNEHKAWPSIGTLQAESGASRKVVVAALKRGCALGLLVRLKEVGERGQAKYYLTAKLRHLVGLLDHGYVSKTVERLVEEDGADPRLQQLGPSDLGRLEDLVGTSETFVSVSEVIDQLAGGAA